MDQYAALVSINDSAVTLTLQSGIMKDCRKLYWKLKGILFHSVYNYEKISFIILWIIVCIMTSWNSFLYTWSTEKNPFCFLEIKEVLLATRNGLVSGLKFVSPLFYFPWFSTGKCKHINIKYQFIPAKIQKYVNKHML